MKPSPVLWQDLEALALGSLTEPLIEADELMTGGTAPSPQQPCRELQRISGTKRMQEKHARRSFSQLVARLHLGPVSGQARHDLSRLVFVEARQGVVASPPCKGRITFDRCCPPDDHGSVFLSDLLHEKTL